MMPGGQQEAKTEPYATTRTEGKKRKQEHIKQWYKAGPY
jgi:hypothetical protein